MATNTQAIVTLAIPPAQFPDIVATRTLTIIVNGGAPAIQAVDPKATTATLDVDFGSTFTATLTDALASGTKSDPSNVLTFEVAPPKPGDLSAKVTGETTPPPPPPPSA